MVIYLTYFERIAIVQASYLISPIPYSLFPIPYSLFAIRYSLFPIRYSLFTSFHPPFPVAPNRPAEGTFPPCEHPLRLPGPIPPRNRPATEPETKTAFRAEGSEKPGSSLTVRRQPRQPLGFGRNRSPGHALAPPRPIGTRGILPADTSAATQGQRRPGTRLTRSKSYYSAPFRH
jgi:hypothetical protein